MPRPKYLPYQPRPMGTPEIVAGCREFQQKMQTRRSVRSFSSEGVPRSVIESIISIAASAPSGANRQPWKFVAVADPTIKRAIRLAAEAEERKSYEGRMPKEWREALEPLGTDWQKPFLEAAPWLIVVFEERHGYNADRTVRKNYYVKESVGIACGFMIAAIHTAGLATLTHTPSPMGFLSEILGRPENETPFILFPVGYPSVDCVVPDIPKKSLSDVAVFLDGTAGDAGK